MLSLFDHTITLRRDGAPTALVSRSRRRVSTVRRATTLAVGGCVLTGVSAHAAVGTTPNPVSVSATVSTSFPIKGVTVSATGTLGFASCTGGSSPANGTAMGFPNATCSTTSYTVTNTGNTTEAISIAGSAGTPSDNGTTWSLCGGAGDPTCSNTSNAGSPGPNQYGMTATSPTGSPGVRLSLSAQCDAVFPNCQAVPAGSGGSDTEQLGLVGPQSSTDQSPTFSMTVVYIAS
jgi:hypothetical protein